MEYKNIVLCYLSRVLIIDIVDRDILIHQVGLFVQGVLSKSGLFDANRTPKLSCLGFADDTL